MSEEPIVAEMSQRIPVADPAHMRKGARRAIRAGVVLLVLLTGFTAGGINMLRAGELPGLPFAVGGPTAQLAIIAIIAGSLRARYSLSDGAITSRAVIQARAVFRTTGWVLVAVGVGIATYGVVRAISGDWWTFLTMSIMAFVLTILHGATRRLVQGANHQIQQAATD